MPLVLHTNPNDLEIGEWLYWEGGLWARLPCGHLWNAYNLVPSGWEVMGPPEAPTATPSIYCHTPPEGSRQATNCWHGFLTAGEWKSC